MCAHAPGSLTVICTLVMLQHDRCLSDRTSFIKKGFWWKDLSETAKVFYVAERHARRSECSNSLMDKRLPLAVPLHRAGTECCA